MEDYRKAEIVSGLFVCVAIVVLGLFAFRVGTFDLWGLFKGESQLFRAHFLDVQTLAPGAEVKVAGEPVGNVVSVQMVEGELEQEHVRLLRGTWREEDASKLQKGKRRQLVEVVFELVEPTLKLDKDTAHVRLGRDSLITLHYLDLDLGVWETGDEPATIFEAGFDEEGHLLRADEEQGFEELVAMAKPVIREAEKALRNVNERVLTSENAAAVSSVLDRFDDLLQSTHKTVASIDEVILSPSNEERVAGILRGLDKMATTGENVFEDIAFLLDREDGVVRQILSQLADATQDLDGRIDSLQTELQGAISSARKLVDDNSADLHESVRRLRRGLWQAELALRKIRANPAVLFFGDEETDYQATDTDDSMARRNGRAPPYGQRSEVADE